MLGLRLIEALGLAPLRLGEADGEAALMLGL
jgi:hypothetical protein